MASARRLALRNERGRRRTLVRIRVGNLVFFSLFVSPHVCNDNVTQKTAHRRYLILPRPVAAERVITVTTEVLERLPPTPAKYSNREHLMF